MPSCDDCRRWVYNDEWKRSERAGIPTRRRENNPPPCYRCPKIPPGEEPTWANAAELKGDLRRAWLHYLECRATGRFPDDPLVGLHARVIRGVYDAVDQANVRRVMARLGILFGDLDG